MSAVFQTSIPGKDDLRQVLITTLGAETFPVPLMDKDTFKGMPLGILLTLTHPASSPLVNVPGDNDTITVDRLQNVSTTTCTIKFHSRPPSSTTDTFVSPLMPLTNPAPFPVSDDIPIFTCKKGEVLWATVDKATTIILVVGRKGRFSGC